MRCPLIDTCPRLVTKRVFERTCLTDHHEGCLYYTTQDISQCIMPLKGKKPSEWRKDKEIKMRCMLWDTCDVRDPEKCPFPFSPEGKRIVRELCHEDFRQEGIKQENDL